MSNRDFEDLEGTGFCFCFSFSIIIFELIFLFTLLLHLNESELISLLECSEFSSVFTSDSGSDTGM